MKHINCGGEIEKIVYKHECDFKEVHVVVCSRCGLIAKETIPYEDLEKIGKIKNNLKLTPKTSFKITKKHIYVKKHITDMVYYWEKIAKLKEE